MASDKATVRYIRGKPGTIIIITTRPDGTEIRTIARTIPPELLRELKDDVENEVQQAG